ncbi:hypothetical protein [Salipiger mangrovisoli]|uniref:Uncharacterized protein n=1 Tax=Salipiger mangrovisoli TaxID=2865933 RepID=A0ABR9X836_9RHOB|nr:hypothetical protein [Salipiger mangrovisoli]MBE9639713.1 hypothetical protein [Salipiger mangrovisoli]
MNEKGFEAVWGQVRVAVASCLANTRLTPVCLYNGGRSAHVARLRAIGVHVVAHRSSLEPVLRRGYGEAYDLYSGHWLRVDIPMVEQEDDVVLYADVDVMFLAHPAPRRLSRPLAAAPERYRWRYPHFNSGVMVMNLPRLRALAEPFAAAISRRFRKPWSPPGHDQVSYNAFFRWRHARLPAGMNWKPYWGIGQDVSIVHFHGPKPPHVRALAAGGGQRFIPEYDRLWRLDRAAYEHYCRQYAVFEAR